MNAADIDAILFATLEDRKLTRTEKQALQAVLEERKASEALLALFRSRAFELARDSVSDHRARAVITWLEDMVKTLLPAREVSQVDVQFSPGEGPLRTIVSIGRIGALLRGGGLERRWRGGPLTGARPSSEPQCAPPAGN
jgi:mitochondrial cardiolipin hydrolase